MLTLTEAELNADPTTVFAIKAKIGEGSYGAVYSAVHLRSNTLVAIKQIPVENEDLEESIKEINMMKGESTAVVAFYGSYLTSENLWIVMELCAAGSVADMMQLCRKTLSEPQIAVICKQVLRGLSYLHSKRKIHRDIKAGNILINADGEAKLADFGVAGQLSDSQSKRQTVIGTPFWMAPEVIQEVGYGLSADIWSLGITCIEMADGRPPYHNIHPMRAIFMIPTKPPPRLENEERFSPALVTFIARCLTKDPTERPSADALLQDTFITSAGSLSVLSDIVKETLDRISKHGFGGDGDDDDADELSETDIAPSVSHHVKTMRAVRPRPSDNDDEENDDGDMTIKQQRPLRVADAPPSETKPPHLPDAEETGTMVIVTDFAGSSETIRAMALGSASTDPQPDYARNVRKPRNQDDSPLVELSSDTLRPSKGTTGHLGLSSNIQPEPPSLSPKKKTAIPPPLGSNSNAQPPEFALSPKKIGGGAAAYRPGTKPVSPIPSPGLTRRPSNLNHTNYQSLPPAPQSLSVENLSNLLSDLQISLEAEISALRQKYDQKRKPIIEAIIEKGGVIPRNV